MIRLYEPIGDNVTIDEEINKNIKKLCMLLDYDIASVINFDKENKIAKSKKIFFKKDGECIQLSKNWVKVIEDSEKDMLSLLLERKQILLYEKDNYQNNEYLPITGNAEREIYIPIFLDLKNSKDSGKDLIACIYLSTFNFDNAVEISQIIEGEVCEVIYNLTRLYEIIYLVRQKKESVYNLINMMSEITREKEPFMILHPYHVAQLSKEIGKGLNLSEEALEEIYFAGLLHDIGKAYLDRDILNKQGSLTENEFSTLKGHSVYGANIVKSIIGLEEISLVVRHHHERYNGMGYPDGLKGEEIPLGSRIICVADAVDAMISQRSYRSPRSIDFVFNELLNNKGKQFDPNIVDVMISILTKTKEEISNIITDSIIWSTLTITTSKKIFSIEGTLRNHSFGCFFRTEKFNFLSEINKTDITGVNLYINKNNNEVVQYKVNLDFYKENEIFISNFKSISLEDSFNILWDLVGELYLSTYSSYAVKICKIGGSALMFYSSENQINIPAEDRVFNFKIYFERNKSILISGKITKSFKTGHNTYYELTYVNVPENIKDEIFRQIFRRQLDVKHLISKAM